MVETEEKLETIEVVKRNGKKVEFDGTKLRLTDEGMNVYNSIVTDLLEKL